MRIFLAGASGAIGRRLVPLLIAAGHDVTGTTRSADAARKLEAAGVRAAIVDVYDATALERAAIDAQPEAVVHQLTDLPQSLRREGVGRIVSAQCAHPRRRHAQFDRGGAGGWRPTLHRAKHCVRLCAWPRAACGGRSAQSGRWTSSGNGARRRRYGTTSPCVRHGGVRASLRSVLRSRHVERRPKPQAGAAHRCCRPGDRACAHARRARHLQHR